MTSNDSQRAGAKMQIPGRQDIENRVTHETEKLREEMHKERERELAKVRIFDRNQQEKKK